MNADNPQAPDSQETVTPSAPPPQMPPRTGPAGFAQFAQPAPTSDPRAKSPGLACFLSLMPGLGQVYVGYYPRGFVHVLVVASLITILATGDMDELAPLFGLFLAFFWLYNIIDAGRRAVFYNMMLSGQGDVELPQDFQMPSRGGTLFGGVALVAAGLVLLLHTRWDMSMAWIEEWWPLLPIVFGIYLVTRGMLDRADNRD